MIAPDRPPRLFRSERMGQGLSVYLPASALSRLVGLVRALVLARVMASPEQWGLLQIALLVVNLLNPLCSLGLNDSLQRYVPMHETRGTLRQFMRLALPLVLILGAVSCGVVLIFARPLGGLLFTALGSSTAPSHADAETSLTRMAALTAFGLVAFFFIFSTLKGLRMFRAAGLIELTLNVVFTAMAIVISRLGSGLATPVVGCYAVALLGMSLLVSLPLGRAVGRIEPSLSLPTGQDDFVPRAVLGQMFRFSLWSALAAVTWQVLLGYPMWYLNKAAGSTAAAVFVGVQLLAQAMVLVANSIVAVAETAVTKTWEAHGSAHADRNLLLVYKATTLLLLAGGVLAIALTRPILHLLPTQYASGAPIFRLLILFFLLAGHLLFLGIHFHLIERTRHVFVPWLLGVLGHVVFSKWLIQPGMNSTEAQQAAAWAGVAGMSLALVAALVLIVAERRPTDRGLWILIAAGFALAIPSPWAPPIMLGAILLLTATTSVVLTQEQKARLRDQMHAAWRKVASVAGLA